MSHEPFSLFYHGVLIWLECFSMMIHCIRWPPCELNISLFQQQQNLGRRFGTSKMHLSPLVAKAAVRSKAVVLLLLTFCLLLQWESVIVLCFVVCYIMSILVLQSSWWGRESWLLCLICLPGVSWWLSGSSSRCHGIVGGLWLWYFLIILTYYFWSWKPMFDLFECGHFTQVLL